MCLTTPTYYYPVLYGGLGCRGMYVSRSNFVSSTSIPTRRELTRVEACTLVHSTVRGVPPILQ